MLNRNLGQTKILPLGMGTGYDFSKIKSSKDVIKVIRSGIEMGLSLIDTAENYGQGIAENIVGKAIKELRNKVFIATKFSPEHSSYQQVIKACEGSLKRLNTDYIDLYQLHWPNPKVPLEETLKALQDLKKVGKIKNIGLGNLSKKELSKSLKILGKSLVSLQTEYNLFERTIEQSGLLSFCQKNGISVIAYSPLDQGRLTSMDKKQITLLNKLSKKYNSTFAQIILSWLISHQGVLAIPKTSNLNHLNENFQSLKIKLTKKDLEKINKTFYLKLELIPIDQIRISEKGEWHQYTYQTLKEALENKYNFVPSPLDLSQSIKEAEFLKPVRIIPSKTKKYKYDLIGGRIRYWAWRIAFGGNKSIPAYIRKNI